MAIVRTQKHSIFTMSTNFKETKRITTAIQMEWKKKTHEEQDTLCECFMEFIERRGRMLIACNKLSCADRTTSPISAQYHTEQRTYICWDINNATTFQHTNTHRSNCWAVQQPEQGNESSSKMDKIIHFFSLCIHNSVVSRCPHKTCWLRVCWLCVSLCFYAPHAWSCESNQTYVHYLIACIHREPFQFGESFTAASSSTLIFTRERKRSSLRNNLVCKIAVSIVTAIHTTFYSKFNVKCFFFVHFILLLVVVVMIQSLTTD